MLSENTTGNTGERKEEEKKKHRRRNNMKKIPGNEPMYRMRDEIKALSISDEMKEELLSHLEGTIDKVEKHEQIEFIADTTGKIEISSMILRAFGNSFMILLQADTKLMMQRGGTA